MDNKIYLRFMGGLGNQMFQYAFMESLRNRGRDAYPNMDWYKQNQNASLNFVLQEVFPNTKMPVPDEKEVQ